MAESADSDQDADDSSASTFAEELSFSSSTDPELDAWHRAFASPLEQSESGPAAVPALVRPGSALALASRRSLRHKVRPRTTTSRADNWFDPVPQLPLDAMRLGARRDEPLATVAARSVLALRVGEFGAVAGDAAYNRMHTLLNPSSSSHGFCHSADPLVESAYWANDFSSAPLTVCAKGTDSVDAAVDACRAALEKHGDHGLDSVLVTYELGSCAAFLPLFNQVTDEISPSVVVAATLPPASHLAHAPLPHAHVLALHELSLIAAATDFALVTDADVVLRRVGRNASKAAAARVVGRALASVAINAPPIQWRDLSLRSGTSHQRLPLYSVHYAQLGKRHPHIEQLIPRVFSPSSSLATALSDPRRLDTDMLLSAAVYASGLSSRATHDVHRSLLDPIGSQCRLHADPSWAMARGTSVALLVHSATSKKLPAAVTLLAAHSGIGATLLSRLRRFDAALDANAFLHWLPSYVELDDLHDTRDDVADAAAAYHTLGETLSPAPNTPVEYSAKAW
ncbi:uncharacterized protein AMSG_03584 [Thecamonas trahens ATCC 50062]|uniref:Uncharacterized protein n=1 Tax=Thecamonas trahens ATCC 50062 TaxID=461836 RepID=A0A0L0D517_THETB|nr:hypothetical protein AMSG_03584 [Thecamonas trahens ATCC 50062]KNC47156.1 hypothetical protein AMSG_03584 [Thecamonas trahens ATCC 50062]|eukprot:XP_013759930.1 hypothetical protein AMSG_03584 [Thecamonas trahens ATCC 50062]